MADNTKQLERERIIFLQGIKEDDAIKLSKEYPNLVIFSKGDKIDDVWHNGSFNNEYTYYKDNDNYQCDDIMFGANIIKNGVRYSLVKGVHPQRNSININGQNISLYLDKNGFINLVCDTYKIIFDKQTSTYLETTSRYIDANSTIGDLPIPKKEYTITWDANGGLIDNSNTKIQKVTWDWNEENNYWSSIANSSNGTGKITSSTIPNGNTTYYACWNVGPSGYLTKPTPNPTREFYNFDGWQNWDNNNQIPLNSISSNITYVAQWTRNATVLSIISNNNTIPYEGNITLTANVTNGNASQTSWSIISDGDYVFTDLENIGEEFMIYWDNNSPGNISYSPGTITLTEPANNTIEYNTSTTISANATQRIKTISDGTSQTIIVKAENNDAYDTINITVQGKPGNSEVYSVSSYAWEITNGSSYASLSNANTSTCTITNNNTSGANQTVKVRCKVKWADGTENYSSEKTITVNHISTPSTTYYWYVGTSKPTVVNGTVANTETDVWTSIGTTKPNQIYIESVDDYTFPKWYVAIPTEFNFQPYDMTGTELELGAWEDQQDTTTLAEYTIWILANNDASLKSVFK